MNSIVDDGRKNHDLYRMRDISGRLLYVGVTNGGLRRFMEHSKDKTWWREVSTIDVEHVHCSRTAIEMLEREAIQAEHPLYNVVHNRTALAPPVAAPPAVPVGLDGLRGLPEKFGMETIMPLMTAYSALTRDQRVWVALFRHHLPNRGIHSTLTPAHMARLAVLIAICIEYPDCVETKLRHIISGGWGVPVDGDPVMAVGLLSACDAITITHTYFDPATVAAVSLDWEALCA